MARPKKFNSVRVLQDKINEYFEKKANSIEERADTKSGKIFRITVQAPIHITGLCEHLGISNETLNQYEKQEEFSEPIKRAKKKCEAYLVDLCCKGGGTKADFILMNNFKEYWKKEEKVTLDGTIGVANTDMPLQEADRLIKDAIGGKEDTADENAGKE